MTYREFMQARKLMAEEAVGTRLRQAGYAEDAQMAESLKVLRSRRR